MHGTAEECIVVADKCESTEGLDREAQVVFPRGRAHTYSGEDFIQNPGQWIAIYGLGVSNLALQYAKTFSMRK